ncbi:cysteine proteinase [Thozetella sp. PMI_491]|nr:cysteine proteinase [Thozetella sp. PMI_491]
MCAHCRHHFVFHVTPGHQTPGRLEQDGHLLHHYVRTSAQTFRDEGVEESPSFKIYPLVARAEYECSVCAHRVAVDMTAPRLSAKWIDLLTDEQRIRSRIDIARREDPERFDVVKDSLQTGALNTLQAYLRNLTADGATESKRILFRNKIYHLQFGSDAKPLFSYLGFTYARNEDDEEMWVTPVLEPQATTPLNSRRAFYEDVRTEIQSVIAKLPGKHLVESLPRSVLEKLLECGDGKYCHAIGADASDNLGHFDTLGAPRESDPVLLQWAYECQVRVDPARQDAYLRALEGLFKSGKVSRKTESLETFLTTELSKQTVPIATTPLAQALRYFNLAPDCPEPDSYILAVYKTFVEQSPAQRHKHRAMLQQIGSGRNSRQILDIVYNDTMGVKEAYDLLGADRSYVMSGIAVMAQQEIDSAKADPGLVLMALETIARDRPADGPNDTERQEFDHIMASIRDRSTGDGRSQDMQDSSPSLDLPVGLENLRNTCYLNSILQYFFSVTTVRELALRCSHQPCLPSTQDGVIQTLQRLGLSKLPPGRAFLANHFARELGALFQELQTSSKACVRPRQRLANAALMRSFRVRSALEDKTATEEPSAKDLPPLPPRNNVVSASPRITVNPVSDASETASDVSSQTLVNQADDERSYVVVEHQTDKSDADLVDIEMSEASATGSPQREVSRDSDLTVGELAKELDQPNVGSDQMDIDEVMGNMIDLLEAAEEVSQAVDPASGRDSSIRESFFSANVDHRKSTGGPWSTNKRSDRWAVAYPAAKGSRELHDALEPTFGLEQTDTDKLLFLTIEDPAPNFHVYIQRTSLVSKNLNLVQIPETLFLDRYMEADKQSTLFSRRKRAWNINARLTQIEEQLGGASTYGNPTMIADWQQSLGDKGNDDAEWSIVNLDQADDLAPSYDQSRADTTINLNSSAEGPGRELEDVNGEAGLVAEKELLLEERKGLFSEMLSVRYRLHAVLCHVGTSGRAGHYWAWVHDFEQGVWRKYNDTTVTVEETAQVLAQLSTTDKGEPYYVAYVRESEIDKLVQVPRREIPAPEETEPVPGVSRGSPDVEMLETRDAVSVERVEDVEMEPR